MKREKSTNFNEFVINNIRKIMNDRHLKQATLAEYMGCPPSSVSKIFNGYQSLSLDNISNLATALSMREIDIITYPDVYVEREKRIDEPIEAVLQIKLMKEKKDQVLKLIFGENNIEILNK